MLERRELEVLGLGHPAIHDIVYSHRGQQCFSAHAIPPNNDESSSGACSKCFIKKGLLALHFREGDAKQKVTYHFGHVGTNTLDN